MDTPSFLEQIRPRAHARYQALPLFGSVVADFSVWLSARGYKTKTIKSQLKGVRYVDRWLRRKGRRRLYEVTDMDMRMAHHRFRCDSNIGGPIRSLGQFLRERGLISPAHQPPRFFQGASVSPLANTCARSEVSRNRPSSTTSGCSLAGFGSCRPTHIRQG